MIKVVRKYRGNVQQQIVKNNLTGYVDDEGHVRMTVGTWDGRRIYYEVVVTPVDIKRLEKLLREAKTKLGVS